MTFQETMSVLAAMESRFTSGFSATDRTMIEKLYKEVLDKRITNLTCGNCFNDAYIEIYTSLKRWGKLPERDYKLKQGEYIYLFGSGEHKFNPISNELAETFLYSNPNGIEIFETFPEDWQKRALERAQGTNAVKVGQTTTAATKRSTAAKKAAAARWNKKQ